MATSATRTFRRAPHALVACALLALSLTHCNTTDTDSDSPVSVVIGPAGGSLTSSDGHMQVTVPPNALQANVTVTVSPVSAESGGFGRGYEIGPTGTQFTSPVTMTFAFTSVSLGGASASDLRMSVYGPTGWQALANQALDVGAKTVSGTTMHFSQYGITSQSQICPLGSCSGSDSGAGDGG